MIRENPRVSSSNIRDTVAQTSGIQVSKTTIQRTLHRQGYSSRTARKKPLISDVNKKKRMEFAQLHQEKGLDFWQSVLFTDESQYNIFGHDGPAKVWRKKGTALQPQNIRKTVKHGGGSVMVWGCMATTGVGKLVFIDGIMDKTVYLDILKENLKVSAEKLELPSRWIFQQDNDPKHTAHTVREWLLYNTYQNSYIHHHRVRI